MAGDDETVSPGPGETSELVGLVQGLRAAQRLNLRQVEAFSAIVAAGSITGAARMLHVSQPGLSRLLSALERALGFALFERRGKRLIITPDGSAFAGEITRTLAGLRTLERVAEDLRLMRRTTLRIAAIPALCLQVVPRAVAAFLRAHPGVKVQVEALGAQRVVESVAARQVEIGVTQSAGAVPGVATLAAYHSACVCVMPPGHALAGHAAIGPAEVLAHEMILLPPSSAAGMHLAAALRQAPSSRVETFLSSAACAMVVEGMGIAVVDPFTAEMFAPRLLALPFRPVVDFGFELIRPAAQPLSRAGAAFLAILQQSIVEDPRITA